MSRSFLRGLSLLKASARFTPLSYQSRRNGYFVLLPEVPDDTSETNILMRTYDKVPQYANITADTAYRAVGKLIIEFESGLCHLEERLEDPNYPKTFESVFEPIEKLSLPLEWAWMAVRNLFLVRNDEQISRVYYKLQKRVSTAFSRKFSSPQIYRVVRDLHGDIDKYDGDQQQVIRKYMTTCKLMGLDLDKPSTELLHAVLKTISDHAEIYEQKLVHATNSFKQPIDGDITKHFPEHIRQHFATQSGFVVTLFEPQFSTFMAYCGDRRHRWNLHNAATIRASFTNTEWNNSLQIEEIRYARQQQAGVFGYKTYSEMATVTKMASSIDHVVNTLMDLSKKIDPVAKQNVSELQSFCAEKGFKAPLEQWDLAYWRRRFKEARLKIDENHLRQLFPLEAVLQGVCNILEKFFGIELREIQSKEPLWAPDVKVFEVAIDGKEVGTILMDLPSRGDKYPGSWCHSLKTRCAATRSSPVASIVISLQNRTFVTFSELSDLLKNLGHAIQHTVSRARYLEVSGLAYVPWDTSQTVPELFNMLLLDKRFARMLCAEERLPDDYHKKIIDRRLHMGSVDLQQEIYLSLLDLELYSTNEFWQDVVRRLKPKLITAVPFHEQDVYHVCSFSDIISGVMGASYYTKVWSRMIAAEVFYTMQKCQNETDTINVARRFRDNILIDGGYVTPVQAFRKFCGRDPEADSLLAVMKLQEEPI